MSLSAKIAIVAGLCLAVAPAQANCDYPDAGGAPTLRAAALSFMQLPRFSETVAAVRIGDQSGVSIMMGTMCQTDQGSKPLPLGPAALGNACGFSLPDKGFAEGVVAR